MKSLCRSWQECQNAGKQKQCSLWFWGNSGPSFTSILCQWENVCSLLAFSSCFSPILNLFFITNTESAVKIYLVVLEQGSQTSLHSLQTTEKCTMGFSCHVVTEPWLCSIRCCTPTPSLFRPKQHYLYLWGSLFFPQTVSLSSWSVCCSHTTQQAGCVLEKAVGFSPFSFLSFCCQGMCACSGMMKTAWAPKNFLHSFSAFHLSFLWELRFKHWGCSCSAPACRCHRKVTVMNPWVVPVWAAVQHLNRNGWETI